MAVYTYKFQGNREHEVVVDHPFKGSVLVNLDGRQIKESNVQEFTHSFDVDGKTCRLKIAYEEVNYGIAKMQSWVHTFTVDGVSIKSQ